MVHGMCIVYMDWRGEYQLAIYNVIIFFRIVYNDNSIKIQLNKYTKINELLGQFTSGKIITF